MFLNRKKCNLMYNFFQAFPFIYVLMSHKTEAAYVHVLQYLKANVLDLRPKTIITDFESSLRNAFKCVFPAVKMVGCWFHYTNALRRKASRIPGFISKLNRNREAKQLFSKFFNIQLLKPAQIKEAFNMLKADAMQNNFCTGGALRGRHSAGARRDAARRDGTGRRVVITHGPYVIPPHA